MCLIVHEGRKNGGQGWAEYDALFRQHAAAAKLDEDEANTDWARLEPSLHTSCLIGARDGEGVLCTLCSGSDHPVSSCALLAITKQQPTSQQSPSTRARACLTASNFPICIQWNKGDCRREDCRYHHTCATCPGLHRAMDCPHSSKDFLQEGC